MTYASFKFLHLLGTVLLLGNVTVTSVWKVFADRSRCPITIAFAQRLVTGTDWAFTGSGIALMVIGGYGMTKTAAMPLLGAPWLVWGQLLFVASGAVWLCVLLPLQTAQAKMAREFATGAGVPEAYWKLSRQWLVWGIVATVPLVAALYVMVSKRA